MSRETATRWRRVALLLAVLALVELTLVAVLLVAPRQAPELPAGDTAAGAPAGGVLPEPPEPRLELQPARLEDLPGWRRDELAEALPALRRSCRVWEQLPAERPVGGEAWAGTVGDWRVACAALGAAGTTEAVERAVAATLRPFRVTNRGDGEGLFTGYYEASLRGSRRKSERYPIPLYLRPPDLVMVDLGKFRPTLSGQRIAGRVSGGALEPLPDRSSIYGGALGGRGLELLWVDDPVDAFFLEIQGSGRVQLDTGEVLRVGYAAQNGHPYTAIGRTLIDRGELSREEVSMQSIRTWLESHPEEAEEVMASNASYVFFRQLTGEAGPVGSLGVPLTPGRSLAIDPRFVPLGLPLWLDTTAPSPRAGEEPRPLQRLVVAQDTGGAIRGAVRGDVFWGHGEEAAEVAGRMNQPGRLWVLLPRDLAPPEVAAAGASPGGDRGGRGPAGGARAQGAERPSR